MEKYCILHTTFTAAVFPTNSQILTVVLFSHGDFDGNFQTHRHVTKRILIYGRVAVIHGCAVLQFVRDIWFIKIIVGYTE
jgi:hypothetical protein